MITKIIDNIIESHFPDASQKQVGELKYALTHLADVSKKRGIELACSIAADYDKLSGHTHLVSDCIRSKLNLLNRRNIRKNSNVKKPVKKAEKKKA